MILPLLRDLQFAPGFFLRYIKLDASQPGLSGTIPTEFGNTRWAKSVNMMYVNAQEARLSGTIPTQLGRLTRMGEAESGLWLDGQWLSGTIPSELGLLTNTKALELWSNCLSGTIPPSLANLHPKQCELTKSQSPRAQPGCDKDPDPHHACSPDNMFDCPLPPGVSCAINASCGPGPYPVGSKCFDR